MAAPPVTETLELEQIQGLVLRGYGKLAARFLLLHVDDAELARAYLRDLSGRIDRGHKTTGPEALQVAFTAAGLEALEVPKSARDSFQREFIEGMAEPVRSVSLGDDPSTWQWGHEPSVHVLVMIYAHAQMLDTRVDDERARMTGLSLVREQHTHARKDQKEHFGWRDGLSMPVFAGVPDEPGRGKPQEWWTTPLAPGEFVLGYHNEYGCLTESPTVEPADDPANHLPTTADGRKDLGKNGTYLVYREITQKVHELWTYLADHSREPGGDRVEKAVALGAKMVGRWPGGAPLVTSPQRDERAHATDNEFKYKEPDEGGLRCPIGSHIRRANPRDVLGSGRDAVDSTIMVRKHQMIRRGRPFGPPVSQHMEPREMIEAKPDGVDRGLHFICLVGHITRQFEFVQRSWITSANFGALFKDGDPISAMRRPGGDPNPNNEFTCPASPVRRKYTGIPPFTHVVGGAYFFLPSLAALKFIARHP
jgi:Dyp-type peroxidase family